jgi:YccS/YhfK family integral membrane protein
MLMRVSLPPASLIDTWRRLRGSDRFAECLRVLLGLGGVVLYCLAEGRFADAIPALLGVIACALAETEDHWRSRLVTLLVTLACYAVAAGAVQLLLPHPALFALGLPLATFALVMLGAASHRYAAIAGSTLLLSVYTMIAADAAARSGAHPGVFGESALLLGGAAWYGLLSLLWSALSPQQAVRHALARTFDALAGYLESKAALFAPLPGVDREALQQDLAMRNEKVVQALNETRLVLIDRIGPRRPSGPTAERLRLYFAAQDIHERVSSSHYPYDALAEAFFHSDVLFRCEHLLRRHAGLCRQRARTLRLRTSLQVDGTARAALNDVHDAIDALRMQSAPPTTQLLQSLDALLRNMEAIQALLEHEQPASGPVPGEESALQDPGPGNLAEAWERIRIQFTPRSFRFRHALRLALALLAGYAVLRVVHPLNGYWILLTTLLVCQPSYGATRRRLLQRTAGTLAGLVAGWAALRLLPFGPAQVPLLIVAGVVFFAARQRRYTLATAAITLFVVLCFNQVGNGYEVMWPRMVDTLIGVAITALAIHLVLPDWQGRRLDQVMADTLRCDARYLARILAQYAEGRRDDLPYRIARRDAHNADASLSGVLSNMLREPGRHRRGGEALLRFLGAAHVLLSQLSALGANRQALAAGHAREAVQACGARTVEALEQLAEALETNEPAPLLLALPAYVGGDETARLVLGQLALIQAQRERLAELALEVRDS